MLQDKETITVKKMKAEIKKKVTKPVDKSVDNSIYKSSLVLPEVIDGDNVGLSKDTVFNTISIKLNVMNNEQLKQYSKAEIESKIELLLPAYQAEGIEPTEQALVDGVMHMMATQTKMDAI